MREIDLIGYLPPMLAEVREIRAALYAQNPEIEKLGKAAQQVLDEQFIHSAQGEGLLRWEAMLGIAALADDPLEVRRFRVLGRLNEQLPFSVRRLHEMLAALTGAQGYLLEIDVQRHLLRVQLELTAKRMLPEAEALLRRVAPANMAVSFALIYNIYNRLRPFTHATFAAKTHQGLREEALP